MLRRVVTITGMMALAAATLSADFTYQETSTITGGVLKSAMAIAGVFSKQAREPIQSTVSVKGDRMLHKSQTHASVIDLASGTITSIDFQKKTYSVMTFDEMKQMLEQMQQRMKKGGDNQAQMNFKVEAKATDRTKQVAGVDCKEMILKMTMEGTDQTNGQKGAMVITTDMWIGPASAGYKEVREFYRRMAEKINWTPGGNMFMSNPDAAKGMAEVYKEVAKLDGVPVQQMITMGAEGTVPPSGSQPSPEAQQQPQQQPERPSVGSALGGALGGRFGIGRKKTSSETPQQPTNTSGGGGTASGSLLEMTTELNSFSQAPVDDAQFAIPAGFKKVEPDSKRMRLEVTDCPSRLASR